MSCQGTHAHNKSYVANTKASVPLEYHVVNLFRLNTVKRMF